MPIINRDKLAKLMDIRGYNQINLARATGLSTSLISKILKNDQQSVSTKTLVAIGEILNILPAYLIDDSILGPPEINQVLQELSEDERKLLSVFYDKSNLPILKATSEAIKNDIKPEEIVQMLKILVEAKKELS